MDSRVYSANPDEKDQQMPGKFTLPRTDALSILRRIDTS